MMYMCAGDLHEDTEEKPQYKSCFEQIMHLRVLAPYAELSYW